jgi:hypothetical protein
MDRSIAVSDGLRPKAPSWSIAWPRPNSNLALYERNLRNLAVGAGRFDGGLIGCTQAANDGVVGHSAASAATATSSNDAS